MPPDLRFSADFSREPCSALAEALARHRRLATPPAAAGRGWPTALWLYGLVHFAAVSPRAAQHLAYVHEALRVAVRDPELRVTSPDEAALALSAADLRHLHGDEIGQKVIDVAREFLRTEPRNALGALNHVGHRHRFRRWLPLTRHYTAPAIWVDSLVMVALTAARIARVSADHELARFAYRQPAIFAECLQEPGGFFRHAYLAKTGQTLPRGNTFWLRGHAWAMLALVDLLEQMPCSLPERAGIAWLLVRAAEALEAARLPGCSLWPALLGPPPFGSKPEVSGSLLAGYAMVKGSRLGVLPPRFVELGQGVMCGARGWLRWRGFERLGLTGISGPTNAAPYAWCYGPPLVRSKPDAGYGVAGFLLLARELTLAGADSAP